MNEIEIIENQNDVIYEIPSVTFPAYEEYKEKAQAIAEYINSMSVDETNMKETKQTLAKARKLTDRLNRVRIDMKKDLLKNYTVFENQVKEIVRIVDDADVQLRAKVRELEEIERNRKLSEIREIWDKRVAQYPIIEKAMPDAFDRWITPQHLNKTTTMKAVENDMTDWINKTYNDMATAASMGSDYLAAYAWKGDLAQAIDMVKASREVTESVEELTDGQMTEKFIVFGKKDIELTKLLLNDHNIEYIIE